jgi:hypothetical protein
MPTSPTTSKPQTHQLIRYAILLYWAIFWLFNMVDKVIGGAHFLWVGRDRFAQFQKYFESVGLDSPHVANVALVVAAALEAFAFLFFASAAAREFQGKREAAHRSALIGTVFTLATFTFFSIGDHWFGDRFELLEHTLFWFVSLASWAAFSQLQPAAEDANVALPRRETLLAAVVGSGLALVTGVAIFQHNTTDFAKRSAAIAAEPVGDHLYKVAFPFLGGSTVFENTLALFKAEHPDETIDHIYTVPDPLRLKKADALIFYIATEDRP